MLESLDDPGRILPDSTLATLEKADFEKSRWQTKNTGPTDKNLALQSILDHRQKSDLIPNNLPEVSTYISDKYLP